jgi:cyclophilin family peptidyl-prolyl cis-trans isomerase
MRHITAIATLVVTIITGLAQAADAPAKPQTSTDIVAASKASDWHALDPQQTLYLDLPHGRVVIELAPTFAPNHVKNIKALVTEKYFDGLQILRAQDNYVVQWGDPHADARADDKDKPKPLGHAQRTLKAEFTIAQDHIPFTALPDRDGYAPQTGFSGDFPAARDPKAGTTWMTHCYGTIGVGRDTDSDSGGGTELYAVIGGARWLDRNITVVGRVVQGMEYLSSMPRGGGPMGFYEKPAERTTIRSVQLAADVPEAQRVKLEIMKTDTPTFAAFVESRRNRHDEWYKVPANYIDVCGITIPVRTAE